MKTYCLKNGINVLFVNKTSSDLVLIGFICKTGYIDEFKNFPNGISTMIERLFLKGTHKNPSTKKIWEAIESMGGRWYSETEAEITSYYLLVPHENQFKAISLLAEIIQKSYFEIKDIEETKEEIIEEIKNVRKSVNVNFGLENLYTCFAYSQKKLGSIDQIMTIDQTTILEYLSKQYRPNNCFIVVSGNYQQKLINDLIEQEWSYWLPTVRKQEEVYFDLEVCKNDLPKIPFLQSVKSDTDVNINFLNDEGLIPKELLDQEKNLDNQNTEEKSIQVQVWDNYVERYAIYLMINELLIGGNTGKLYNKGILDEKILNYVQSEYLTFTNSALFSIYYNVDNQNFNQSLEVIMQIFGDLKTTIITTNELNRIKEMTKMTLLVIKSDLLALTILYCKNYILAGHQFEINDIVTKINYIESSQIRSFCLDIFVVKNMSVSIIGTSKEVKLIEKIINKYLG